MTPTLPPTLPRYAIAQRRVLRFLSAVESATTHELAFLFGMKYRTVRSALDALKRRALIATVPASPRQRRRHTSKKGRPVNIAWKAQW